MKKNTGIFIIFLAAIFIFAGCSSNKNQPSSTPTGPSEEEKYISSLNEALLSFNTCADNLSSSIQVLSTNDSLPTQEQQTRIRTAADEFTSACRRISSIHAPSSLEPAYEQMNEAMQSYEKAMQKCNELLDFYSEADTKVRGYSDPVKDSKELRAQAEAIYKEFAQELQQAAIKFNSAAEAFQTLAYAKY